MVYVEIVLLCATIAVFMAAQNNKRDE